MEIKEGKYDSIFGFCVMVALGALAWYGVRVFYPKEPDNSSIRERASTFNLERTQRLSVPLPGNLSSFRGKTVEEILASLPPKPALGGTEFEERFREYAHYCYPSGSLTHRLGEPAISRKTAPANVRKAIYQRDGYQCLLCGSHGPLELDHMRAIMNGGDNSLENLSTLCASCNKSAMKRIDNKINKQRRRRLQERGGITGSAPRKEDKTSHSEIIFDAIAEGVEASVSN